MYLLDTNVISELRCPKPHGAVLAWLRAVPDSDLHISAVSLGEIQAGIELTREQDEQKATEIEQWANRMAASYNLLPMDAESFRIWARLMHRRSDTLYEDAMIAATANCAVNGAACSTVAWTAGGASFTGTFVDGATYTATVTMTADASHTFAGLTAASFNLETVVERARQCRDRRARQDANRSDTRGIARICNAAWRGEHGAGECVALSPKR